MKRIKNNYHLVEISPYPIYTAFSLFSIIISSILIINNYYTGLYSFNSYTAIMFTVGIIILIGNIYKWWEDIIKEGLLKGEHTKKVEEGLNIGFILFIISELIIFASFFFSYFYNSLIPDILLSNIWPPKGIISINSYTIPLLNTALLFFSGFTITGAQYILSIGNKKESNIYIIITLILAFLFILLQYLEYKASPFTINDSVYGSSFFLLTGFHGLHVVIGFLFILFAFIRLNKLHYSSNHSLHFSFSALYYHFVDIIWIFLFLSLYLWGS